MELNGSRFEDILLSVMYHRADQAPVDALRKIFPFTEVTPDNVFFYEEIILHMSPKGYAEVMPRLFDYLESGKNALDANIVDVIETLSSEEQSGWDNARQWLKKLNSTERGNLLSKVLDVRKRAEVEAIEIPFLKFWEQKICN